MPDKLTTDYLLKQGQVFGHYTAVKCLGIGGMGEVWLAKHNTLGICHALKLLQPLVAISAPGYVARFEQEAQIACRLKHPNLIEVYDAATDVITYPDGQRINVYYIAMEYVGGGSLTNLLKKCHRLAPEPTLEIIGQVASALVAVQAQNIVHRDIKPDNIMFTDTGQVKLGDLGIAKSINDGEHGITRTGSMMGTPYYMSPEQVLDSSKVDIRADIYSLGCVAVEMLTGRKPYMEDTLAKLYAQIMSPKEIPDVRKTVPDIPRKIALLVADMCAKKLEKRIQSPSELLERINQILGKKAEIEQPIPAMAPTTPVKLPEQHHATMVTIDFFNGDSPTEEKESPNEIVTIPPKDKLRVTQATVDYSHDERVGESTALPLTKLPNPPSSEKLTLPLAQPTQQASSGVSSMQKTVPFLEDKAASPARKRLQEGLGNRSQKNIKSVAMLAGVAIITVMAIVAIVSVGVWVKIARNTGNIQNTDNNYAMEHKASNKTSKMELHKDGERPEVVPFINDMVQNGSVKEEDVAGSAVPAETPSIQEKPIKADDAVDKPVKADDVALASGRFFMKGEGVDKSVGEVTSGQVPAKKSQDDGYVDLPTKGAELSVTDSLAERLDNARDLYRKAREATFNLSKAQNYGELEALGHVIFDNCRNIGLLYLQTSVAEMNSNEYAKFQELNAEASQLGEAGNAIGEMMLGLLDLQQLAGDKKKKTEKRRESLKAQLTEQFEFFEDNAFRVYRPIARGILNEAQKIE